MLSWGMWVITPHLVRGPSDYNYFYSFLLPFEHPHSRDAVSAQWIACFRVFLLLEREVGSLR